MSTADYRRCPACGALNYANTPCLNGCTDEQVRAALDMWGAWVANIEAATVKLAADIAAQTGPR